MTIGILIFSKPHDDAFSGSDRLVEAGQAAGFTTIKLYEPHLSFVDGNIFHEGQPFPPVDVIIVRPNFVEEPSLRTYAVQMLAETGTRIINGNVGFTWAKNKLTQHVLFAKHDLPCPRWGIARKPEDAVAVAKEIGFPAIIKVAFGTHGKGVFLAKDEETLWPIADYLAIRDRNPLIIEEFIQEARSTDIRAFVIGGKVVGAMMRTAAEGDVRANTSNRGTGSVGELSKDETDLAIKAAEVFGLEIAGVDLIRSKRGTLILEVNSNPGFKELEAVTNLDIARMIIDYAASVESCLESRM